MKKLILNLCVLSGLVLGATSEAADKAKAVFISGKPSHGRLAHEHRAGNMILAKGLNESGLPIEAVLVPHYGYPKDESILNGADTIVIFCTGHGGHVLNPKLKQFDALMKKGIGVVMIHWATEAIKGDPGNKFLEWMGGYFEGNWSVNPHWDADFKTLPTHAITRGVKPFKINDEWYFHMRFVKDMKGVTPILSAHPPKSTMKRRDGHHSGNPHVRAAMERGEIQHVAWAYERPNGGRGFGFTGGHFHRNWGQDDFRKIVLNAITWVAKAEVPKDGVPSDKITEADLEENQDYPKPGSKRK